MRRICGAIVGLILLASPAAAASSAEIATRARDALNALQHHAAEPAATGKRLDPTRPPPVRLEA